MALEEDRFLGSLVGLAVGDALGSPLEFSKRDALEPVTEMRGGGKFQLKAGQWTDDTSMALCIAASLVETQTFDLRDQLDRFIRWCEEGYLTSTGFAFGIGQQTLLALGDYSRTGQVMRTESTRWRSGNGSLMRLAPVPMVFATDPEMAKQASAASSITTHPVLECREACGAYGYLIAGALSGWDKERILDESSSLASEVSSPELRSVLAGEYLKKSRDEILFTGYVIHTMEAALWAFMQAPDFGTGALLAVNLADDSDTVGAVYGQLAGAHFGYVSIPLEWRKQLHSEEMIVETARNLHQLSAQGISLPASVVSVSSCI